MKFRTEIALPPYPFQITHSHRVMLIGSCFSDHIGQFFARSGFNTLSNPFGTLFNPASIALAIRLSLNPERFSDLFVDRYNDLWISFAHHGKFSHPDKEIFKSNIELQLKNTSDFIRKSDFLFITFGTAYYYLHVKKQITVSNCHKIPAAEFDKRRMEPREIEEAFVSLLEELHQVNPDIKLIFTVSPIRHLSDGFHENQLSKSILHLAIEKLVGLNNRFYFPSYEILQDDLRDYRFYAKDLCHPSESAIEYIREKVSQAFFSPKTVEEIKRIEKENKRKEHVTLMINGK